MALWEEGQEAAEAKPDLVLVSIGLWDTLHETGPEEVRDKLKAVAEGMQRLGNGGNGTATTATTFRTWLSTTAVVDGRLMTEDKKLHVGVFRRAVKESGLPQQVSRMSGGAKQGHGFLSI